jgi:hypothetical protein
MSEASYPGYREWLTKTCDRAGFTPNVLQDVDLERTMIHAVAAGPGVSRARAIKKTGARECGIPATQSHGQDGKLCRMEGRESIGCSESVRADRRANGPEHPLKCVGFDPDAAGAGLRSRLRSILGSASRRKFCKDYAVYFWPVSESPENQLPKHFGLKSKKNKTPGDEHCLDSPGAELLAWF